MSFPLSEIKKCVSFSLYLWRYPVDNRHVIVNVYFDLNHIRTSEEESKGTQECTWLRFHFHSIWNQAHLCLGFPLGTGNAWGRVGKFLFIELLFIISASWHGTDHTAVSTLWKKAYTALHLWFVYFSECSYNSVKFLSVKLWCNVYEYCFSIKPVFFNRRIWGLSSRHALLFVVCYSPSPGPVCFLLLLLQLPPPSDQGLGNISTAWLMLLPVFLFLRPLEQRLLRVLVWM